MHSQESLIHYILFFPDHCRELRLGLTPLLVAAREGHEVIFEELVRCGANMNSRTNLGEDIRYLAWQQGNTLFSSNEPLSLVIAELLSTASATTFSLKAKLYEERQAFGMIDYDIKL